MECMNEESSKRGHSSKDADERRCKMKPLKSVDEETLLQAIGAIFLVCFIGVSIYLFMKCPLAMLALFLLRIVIGMIVDEIRRRQNEDE